MTNLTVLELAKILDDYAVEVNRRFNLKLSKITKFGDARDRYARTLAATEGMISLLPKRDQVRLTSVWKRYLIASKQQDAEVQVLVDKLNKIINYKNES